MRLYVNIRVSQIAIYRDATFRQFSTTDVGSRTQVQDSMLTGVGLRKLTTLDESFPSVGGSEPMAGVRGTVSKRGRKRRVAKRGCLTVRGKS